MKAVVAAFNQKKALVGAFSVIVQLHRLIINSAIPSPAIIWPASTDDLHSIADCEHLYLVSGKEGLWRSRRWEISLQLAATTRLLYSSLT